MKRSPYFPGTKSVSSVMDKMLKPYLQKGGYAFATLILDWQKIVGQEIAAYTLPLKLIFSKKEKDVYTLILQVEPASALMVGFQKGLILEKITTFYGRKFIVDIDLKQIPLHKKKREHKKIKALIPLSQDLKEKIQDIQNEELKKALEAFGSTFFNR
jgi:hypothetical protein